VDWRAACAAQLHARAHAFSNAMQGSTPRRVDRWQ